MERVPRGSVAEVARSPWRQALHLFELGAPADTAICNAAAWSQESLRGPSLSCNELCR